MAAPATAQSSAPTAPVVEVRSYNLKPGTRDRFQQTCLREALPLLQRWKVDVVAYGPSLHDRDSFYLMRAFPGLEARQRSEDACYGSSEWTAVPRAAILADIESYTTIVVRLDPVSLDGLRASLRAGSATTKKTVMSASASSHSDLAELLVLNQDYFRSVQTSDVTRFTAMLADEFLAPSPMAHCSPRPRSSRRPRSRSRSGICRRTT